MSDRANGYEGLAGQYAGSRSATIGVAAVLRWAGRWPAGASILDVGCGPGVPLAAALVDAGYAVSGVDASPEMIRLFSERFPGVPVECAPVETARFFGRTFDGVLAWGLLFLLDEEAQRAAIRRMAEAVKVRGSLLFTAPEQPLEWVDALTERRSVSLGRAGYLAALEAAGLALTGEDADEGENHYWIATKA